MSPRYYSVILHIVTLRIPFSSRRFPVYFNHSLPAIFQLHSEADPVDTFLPSSLQALSNLFSESYECTLTVPSTFQKKSGVDWWNCKRRIISDKTETKIHPRAPRVLFKCLNSLICPIYPIAKITPDCSLFNCNESGMKLEWIMKLWILDRSGIELKTLKTKSHLGWKC